MNVCAAAEPAVELKNVSFCYPGSRKPSIKNVSLQVKSGEFVVFTGESGCGKTTLTRIVNGLGEKFYEGTLTGEARLLGNNISDLPLWEIGKLAGSVFQDPGSQFFASITEDEIAFGCENYGVPYEELNVRVSEAVRRINGGNLRGKEIYPMSSGEKQKIAVASVNAVNPRIYVFDEPSANLDMKSVEALKKLMGKLKAEGHTIIVAEHRLYYLTGLADRFVYMRDGNIETEWSPDEIRSLTEAERETYGIRAADLSQVKADVHPEKSAAESLSVRNLSFSYRKHPVLEHISFQVSAGDIAAIIGPNGAGKTTLAGILCGIRKETAGQIRFCGKAVPYRKRRDAAYFVMQNTDCQLFGDSVADELRLNRKNAAEPEIEALLELYGLLEYKDRHPAALSGGQKQRLALAVSDWIDAPVLILDEPTSGLDFRNMQRISRHLKLLAQKGKTILVITHDLEFAAATCSQVLFLKDGRHMEQFALWNHMEKLRSLLYE